MDKFEGQKNLIEEWVFGESTWLQDSDRKRFFLTRHAGKDVQPIARPLLPHTMGARVHPVSHGECSGVFPGEFEYCPFCGEKLRSVDPEPFAWLPPYGPGDGLRVFNRIGLPSEQIANEFPLPNGNGSLAFLVDRVGTQHPVLLALNRSAGHISVFDSVGAMWIELEHGIGSRLEDDRNLPEWSWAVASISGTGGGLCWPTLAGPVWVEFDWLDRSWTTTKSEGRCVGGAARLGNRVFAPVIWNDAIVMQSFSSVTRHWTKTPMTGEGPPTTEFLSLPLVDQANSRIHWVTRTGRITLRLSDDQSLHLQWRPWETDSHPCHAVQEYGPPYLDRVSTRYWQFCFDDHDQAYRYYELEGEEAVDRQDEIDGDRLTTGGVSFSQQYEFWRAPWDTPSNDLCDEIRIPLLQFDAGKKGLAIIAVRVATNQLIKELFESADAHMVAFSVEFRNDPPVGYRFQSH